MKKRLIVTIMLGSDPSYFYVKKSFKAYAEKVNADFVSITKVKNNFKSITPKSSFEKAILEKLNLGKFLIDYERVLYIDADILITPKAKDIFNKYQDPHKVYMFNEGLLSNRNKELDLIGSYLNKKIKDKNYFNAGVILFSQKSSFLNDIDEKSLAYFYKRSNFFEQTYMNYLCRRDSLDFVSINKSFNRMSFDGGNDKRFLANFIHYAGNGYCPKKQRPFFILNDYSHLYQHSITLKEKLVFISQYTYLRLLRIINKVRD